MNYQQEQKRQRKPFFTMWRVLGLVTIAIGALFAHAGWRAYQKFDATWQNVSSSGQPAVMVLLPKGALQGTKSHPDGSTWKVFRVESREEVFAIDTANHKRGLAIHKSGVVESRIECATDFTITVYPNGRSRLQRYTVPGAALKETGCTLDGNFEQVYAAEYDPRQDEDQKLVDGMIRHNAGLPEWYWTVKRFRDSLFSR